MISDETKATIDALPKDELVFEINKRNRSRFQGDKFAYLETRLAALADEERKSQRVEENAHKNKQLFISKLSILVAITTSVISILIGGGWYQEYRKNEQAKIALNEQLITKTLQPVSALLAENKSIYDELSVEPYSELGWGILDSYLIKIRRNGVSRNSYMKNQIDKMVNNNEAILTLLRNYTIKSEELRKQTAAFQEHANRYTSRWKSLIGVFTSNGYFPTGEPIFPKDFPKAVQNEISILRASR